MITSLAAKMQYEAIKEAGTYGGGLADFIEENYPRFSVSNRTDTRATFRNGRVTETPAEMSNEEKEEAWAEYQERNRPQMTDEERYRNEDLRLFSKSPSEIAEEEETKRQFKANIKPLLRESKKQKHKNNSTSFGKAKPWLVVVSRRNGLEINGFKHSVDVDSLVHINDWHGKGNETNSLQIPVTDEDIENIPDIVNTPDYLVYGLKSDRNLDTIGYLKTFPDGTTYYVEEIKNRAGELAAKTMFRIEGRSSENLVEESLHHTSGTSPSAVKLVNTLKRATIVPAFTKNIASGITDVNNKLFSKAETVRGTYNPERRLIELFADRKPETVLHEVSHYFFQNYFAVADKYGYSDYDRGMLRWLSKQGKHEIKSLNDMETQDWENLTETFLRYLNTGNAPTIATRGVFQKAKEWVLDVFEINRDIASNEVKDFFDSLVAREGKMPKSQTEGGESRVLADSSVNVEGEQAEKTDVSQEKLYQLPQGRKVYSVFDLKVGDHTSIGDVQEIDNENKTIKINDNLYSMLLLDTQIQYKGLSIIDKSDTQNNIDNTAEENIKKASENRSEVEKQKLYNTEYNKKAKNYFGTTRNLNEAGYILTDGSLLDLSGKRQGARGGYRALDHLDVAEALENADMYDFINSGNIRYLPESDTIQIVDIPTAAQYQTLSSIINKAGGEVTVQLISDAHNDSFSDYYREYEDLTLSKLKKDINAFYKGAGVQEITQYYQGQIADNVIDGHEVIDGFDENASNDAFVRTKEGRVEHGYITDELAKQIGSSKGGEIRLYNDLDKHIDKGRKKYILSQGYADLIDFVDDTISNWEKIYKGSDKSFLITKSKNKDNIVAVKLERDGKYYKISTAFIGRNGYLKNKKALAERAATNQLLTKSPDAFSGASAINNITLTRGNVKPDYQNKPQPKGLYDAKKGVIKIFESADFSTLPHELAHYWLDNMWHYVRSGNASEKYRQRWNVIANWLNVKQEQAFLTRGQQEKFARGYEQYLLNGNLPTPIIKGAFDDYDRWLKRVYGDMNRLNVRYIDYKKKRPDEEREVRATLKSTQNEPILSRQVLGAGLNGFSIWQGKCQCRLSYGRSYKILDTNDLFC